MIDVNALHVRYGGAAEAALRGVALQAARGALTAIVGPNGSGKSTLVRALLGRAPVQAGQVRIDGQDVATLSRGEVARRVAAVVQREEPAFPLPVRDYLALGRFPHRRGWGGLRADDLQAIGQAADRADVGALLERRTDELSGGEWQRVRVARALAQGGHSLVLDEPSAFLDVGHEMALFELLAALAREGRAVLLVSHQLNLVARFADHLVLLDRGAVAASGPPDAVMRGDILEAVYHWPLVVSRDPAVGAPVLVPLRSRP